MRTDITDPLYTALNTLAEKKAVPQKVIASNWSFLRFGVFTDADMFFHSIPMG